MISYSKHPEVARALVEATKVANVPTPPPGISSVMGEVVRHPAFLAPLAMMAVGGVVGGTQSLVTKLLEAKKKNETFRGMLDLNPTLKGQNQTTVKRVFNSLHSANPHFMNDPMVAGALVHNTIEAQGAYGMDQPMVALAKQVSELSQGRASITSALEKEKKMRSSWAEPAREAVRGGFEAAADIKNKMDALEQPFDKLKREMSAFAHQKAQFEHERAQERREADIRRADEAMAALEARNARENRRVEELEARARAAQPGPGSTPVSGQRGFASVMSRLGSLL